MYNDYVRQDSDPAVDISLFSPTDNIDLTLTTCTFQGYLNDP